MLIDEIRTKLQVATKSGDEVVVSTLRMLMSALEYKKIQKQANFNEKDEIETVLLEAKKRKEAIEIYSKAGEEQRANKEKAELAVLQEFLPEQVTEDEVKRVVMELKDKVPTDSAGKPGKGQLIGMVIGKIGKDKVDGQMVAKVVNEVYD